MRPKLVAPRLLIPAGVVAMAGLCTASAVWAAEDKGVKVAVSDPCEDAIMVPEAIRIVRTWGPAEGGMYGVFELNRNAVQLISPNDKQPMTLQGDAGEHGIDLNPYARFQYRDLHGHWRDNTLRAGHYFGPRAKLSIPSGGRGRFTLFLDFAPLADEARTWRLLLRTSATECFRSLPFQVKRKRVPIEGFVSDPTPKEWTEPRKATPCRQAPPNADIGVRHGCGAAREAGAGLDERE